MIKFKFSGERCAEALNVLQYLDISSGDVNSAIRVLPFFILDADGEYIVRVVLDEDGDILKREGLPDAVLRLKAITPKRSERLAQELVEAVRSIVGPPNGGGSTKPSSTEPAQPPPG